MTWSPKHETWVIANIVTKSLKLSTEWGVILVGTDGKLLLLRTIKFYINTSLFLTLLPFYLIFPPPKTMPSSS